MIRDRKLGNQFHTLDTDRDGRIGRADFASAAARVCTAFGAANGSLAGQQFREQTERLFDASFPGGAGDDSVTEERFRAALSLSKATFDETVRPWAMSLVSVLDGAGEHELRPHRFRALLGAFGVAENDADNAFDHLDLDGSGTIDAIELVEALEEFYCSDDPDAPGNWLFGPVEDPKVSTARLPYPAPEQLSPEVVAILDKLPQLNIFRMLAHAQTAFRPAIELGAAVLAKLDLPGDLRELVVLQVAQTLNAPYVWTQHAGAARTEGSQRSKIVAVRAGRIEAPSLTATERACLAFTEELLHRNTTSDATFANLRTHLPPRQIVELLIVIGTYTMVSRVTTALALDADRGLGQDLIRAVRAS